MGSLFRGSHHRKKLKVAPVFLIIPRVGQNHIYIRCVYGLFGREFTIYTVIYGVYIRFWPTLIIPCPPPPDSSSLNWPHCLFTPPTQTPSNILVWLIAFVWLSLVWFIAFHTPYSDTLKSLCMAHCLFHSRGSLTWSLHQQTHAACFHRQAFHFWSYHILHLIDHRSIGLIAFSFQGVTHVRSTPPNACSVFSPSGFSFLIIPCPPPDSSSLNWPHCLFIPGGHSREVHTTERNWK